MSKTLVDDLIELPRCPHCGVDLTTPYEGLFRARDVVDPEVTELVIAWQCPDCGGRWHRWTDASPTGGIMRRLAEGYLG